MPTAQSKPNASTTALNKHNSLNYQASGEDSPNKDDTENYDGEGYAHQEEPGMEQLNLSLMKRLLAEGRAHSHGLRAQLKHGLELLTDDHPLCQWDGPLLPFEDVDYQKRINHGTEAGYQQHKRWGIPKCGECQDAHRAKRQLERQQARERKAS